MQKLWTRGLAITLTSANLLILCNSVQADSLVGYVNKQYPQGWSLIANPLNNTSGNTLDGLFGNTMPDGTQLSKWTGSAYNTFTYNTVGWRDASLSYVGSSVTLPPGIGAVLFTPVLPPNITWVGNVIHDHGPPPLSDIIRHPATPPASPGIYLLASTFPVVGSTFADIVGRAPNDGEAILTINSLGTPGVVHYDSGSWWDSSSNLVPNPTVGIAESAFFALGGANFANWSLPGVVPEPGTFTLLALGAIILFRGRK